MPLPTSMPKVGIIITVYNGEPYIGPCIKAALDQTYQSFEVIVIDDGSSDGTERICRSIKDSRFRYLNKGQVGRQKALNEGVKSTDAEFIAINDADDLSLPCRLEYTLGFLLAHPNAAYVGTGFSKTTEFTGTIPPAVLKKWLPEAAPSVTWPSRSAVYRRNLFNHSTIMYPKRTWERIGGYDESLTLSEDYDFYLRAMQCGPVALLPGRTVHWYTNPNGVFKQRAAQDNLETLRMIKRRAHELLGLPGWLRLYQPLWEMGFQLTTQFPALLGMIKSLQRVATQHTKYLS